MEFLDVEGMGPRHCITRRTFRGRDGASLHRNPWIGVAIMALNLSGESDWC